MSNNAILYQVYAGTRIEGYRVIYESTKRKKADDFVHSLLKESVDYDKVYIVSKPLSKFDKRRDWED